MLAIGAALTASRELAVMVMVVERPCGIGPDMAAQIIDHPFAAEARRLAGLLPSNQFRGLSIGEHIAKQSQQAGGESGIEFGIVRELQPVHHRWPPGRAR